MFTASSGRRLTDTGDSTCLALGRMVELAGQAAALEPWRCCYPSQERSERIRTETKVVLGEA